MKVLCFFDERDLRHLIFSRASLCLIEAGKKWRLFGYSEPRQPLLCHMLSCVRSSRDVIGYEKLLLLVCCWMVRFSPHTKSASDTSHQAGRSDQQLNAILHERLECFMLSKDLNRRKRNFHLRLCFAFLLANRSWVLWRCLGLLFII